MFTFFQRLFKSDSAPKTEEKIAHPVEATIKDQDEVSSRGVQGDSAILLPDQDSYDINPFAQAIAASILEANAKDGLVYAINGAWGSGKSSAINLVLHHLDAATSTKDFVVTAFNPWWFSGSEALTLSFFQELHATIGKSLSEKARKSLADLGSRLSSAGPLLGGIASLFGSPAAGGAISGGASLLEKLTRLDTTVESERKVVIDALHDQRTKFLIVIDDIDRLATDDALQLFKLIKSVGRLPNVIYLTAFDRTLAERMVAERFPAEGVSYLEKIIQGSFDLPSPDRDDLCNQLLATVSDVMGAPEADRTQRFWNLFHDGVAPLLNTPRDALRLCNSVRVLWPAIGSDVDRADFLTIEAMRMFLPGTYEAIRAHPDLLTGQAPRENHRGSALASEYDKLLLDHLASARHREIAKRALLRLFPRLNAVWGNVWHSGTAGWQRDRLICSREHFATYFALSVKNDAITKLESDALVASAGMQGATAAALRGYVTTPRRKGGTRAALALEELSLRAADIAKSAYFQFVQDLFVVADDIDVRSDSGKAFSIASNQLRIHWLLNNLLLHNVDLQTRSEIIRQAAPKAALSWLISFSDRCKNNIDKSGEENELLTDDDTSKWLYSLSIDRLRAHAADGSLAQAVELPSLLFRWRDRVGPEEVRAWTDRQLRNDDFVVNLAKYLVRETWSHGMGGFGFLGDSVASEAEYVHLEPLSPLLDINSFRNLVRSQLQTSELDAGRREILERFVRTPERDPSS